MAFFFGGEQEATVFDRCQIGQGVLWNSLFCKSNTEPTALEISLMGSQRIDWQFRADDACIKLKRLYPKYSIYIFTANIMPSYQETIM